jgi:hypothetical protein
LNKEEFPKEMIILTKQFDASYLCSSLHRQTSSMRSIDTLIGKVYADMSWFNAPEQGSPG